ncbi:MAG: glycosyltransferase [Carboxylicivirga sp.]|nr:glycosyltransferase [Carboxylicivirga sp.]
MEQTTLYIVLGIYGFCWCFQIFYHQFFMLKTSQFSPSKASDCSTSLSVVICAKNEAQNLQNNIPEICQQDYPDFEVIVVNDCSTDNTELVLAQLKSRFSNLYYTSIPLSQQHYEGKKLALTLGVKAANNEHLVLTDADCRPVSDKWLQEIGAQFSDEKKIVIGHGRFEKRKSLFNLFLRYETFFNAVQYMGFALRGKPFMAVGRNMAYTKSLFTQGNIFKNYFNIASGDDDLFVRQCATKNNTTIQPCYSGQTESIPPLSFSEWMIRKSRHLTTAPVYKPGIKLWLGGEALTRQIFWLLTLCSLFFPTFVPLTMGLLVVRLVLVHVILARAAKKMGENKLYWATILFDLITPFLIGSIWVINIFSAKKKKWK